MGLYDTRSNRKAQTPVGPVVSSVQRERRTPAPTSPPLGQRFWEQRQRLGRLNEERKQRRQQEEWQQQEEQQEEWQRRQDYYRQQQEERKQPAKKREAARNMILEHRRSGEYTPYSAYAIVRGAWSTKDIRYFIEELETAEGPSHCQTVNWNLEIEYWSPRVSRKPIDPWLAAHLTDNTIRAIDAWIGDGAKVDAGWSSRDITHPLYIANYIHPEMVDVKMGTISSIMRHAGIKTEITDILWNKLLDTSHPEMMSYGMQRELASRQRHDAEMADVHDALDSAGVPPCDRSMEARLAALKFSPQNMRASFEDDIAAS
jgi:hypothetical protein